MKLATRILIVFLLLSLIPLGIIIYFSFYNSFKLNAIVQEAGRKFGETTISESVAALMNEEEDHLSVDSKYTAAEIENVLKEVEADTNKLEMYAAYLYNHPDSVTRYSQDNVYAPAQAGRLFGSIEPNDNSWLVVFPAGTDENGNVSDEVMKEIYLTEFMDIGFRGVAENNPYAVQLYLNTKSEITRGMRFIDGQLVRFDAANELSSIESAKVFDFYYLADPEHDPGRQPVWTELYWDPAGLGWMVTCSAPVYRGEEFVGTVSIDVTLKKLVENVLNVKIEDTGFAFLMSSNGQAIAFPDRAAGFLGFNGSLVGDFGDDEQLSFDLTQTNDEKFQAIIEHMRAGETGTVHYISPQTSKEYYIAFAPISPTGWSMGLVVPVDEVVVPVMETKNKIEQNVSEVTSNANNIFRQLIFIFSIVIGIIILSILPLALYISRSISKPIKKLAEGAKRIGSGDFKHRIKINTSGEINDLADSFNKMAGSLNIYQEEISNYSKELEYKVQNKTNELQVLLADEKKGKAELKKQRLAMLNILEDVSESQDSLKHTYRELQQKTSQLAALKNLSDELTKVLDIEEIIMVLNKYLDGLADFSAINYLVVNPNEEGGIIYSSYLKEEVGEKYMGVAEKHLIKYLSEIKNPELKTSLRVIENVQPKYFGKKLNNSNNNAPQEIKYFPLLIEKKMVGIIQLTSTKKGVLAAGATDLINTILTSVSISIDRLETLILAQHSKTVSLVESLKDGVIMFNKNEDLVLMNPAFARCTGFSQKFFNMSDLYRLIAGHDLRKMVRKALDRGDLSQIKEVALVDRFYEVLITPVKDNKGQIVGGAIIFHDNTYLREIDQMKSEFVSVASHQLRTPLTAIKLFTEMMLDNAVGKIKPEQADYLHNIYQSTERMVQLVNDLLSLSRLESGRLRIDPKPTDITGFVQNIIDEIKPVAKVKQVALKFQAEKDLPDTALDINLMRQVIHNLITNAVRYSTGRPKAAVKIDITRQKENYIIKITDNGIGIPEAVQSRIYEKFFRADNAVKTDTEGTGLGLYVSKMIVESSGGRIWFESKEGKGTTFCVSLPLNGMPKKSGDKTLPGEKEISYS